MKTLKCQICDRIHQNGEWLLPEELSDPPKGKAVFSYCRFCVMEMSLTRNKELVKNLRLRLIDVAEPLIEISSHLTVYSAAKKMRDHQQGILGATHDDNLVGILTERDITRRVIAEKLSPRTTLISSVMSTPVKTIRAGASLPEATLKMFLEKLRHLVIKRPSPPHKVVSVRVLSETMVQTLNQAYTLGKKETAKKKRK